MTRDILRFATIAVRRQVCDQQYISKSGGFVDYGEKDDCSTVYVPGRT